MRSIAVLVFLVACGPSKQDGAPATDHRNKSPGATVVPAAGSGSAAAAAQTSRETPCTSHEDCYCRKFDGAEFQEGREPSTCCLVADGCQDALGQKVGSGHCMSCVYD